MSQPPAPTQSSTVQVWRAQALKQLIRLALIFSLPLVLLTSYESLQHGDLLLAALISACYGFVWLSSLNQRVTAPLRATALVLVCFSSGTIMLMQYGLVGGGRLLLLLAVVAAALLLNQSIALGLWLLSLGLSVLLVGATALGQLQFSAEMGERTNDPLGLSTGLLLMLYCSAAIGMTVQSLLDRLDASLKATELANQNLEVQVERRTSELVLALSDNRSVEASLSRQLRYAQSLARCSQVLLGDSASAAPLGSVLEQVLDILRASTVASRAAIAINEERPQIGLSARLLAEAHEPGIAPQDLSKAQPWSQVPPPLREALVAGERFGGPLRRCLADYPAYVAQLEADAVQSALWVPIGVAGRWWGYIKVCDCAAPRDWEPQLGQLLTTSAEMIAALVARRERDSALREQAELLRAVGRMAQVGGWELDLETMKPLWSEQVYIIHEMPLDEPLHVDIALRFYPPEARQLLYSEMERCTQEGVPFDLELPLITSTERRIWVRAQGNPVYQDGRIVRLRGTFQEITARKETELALSAREAHLRLLVDAFPDIMLRLDESGRVIDLHAPSDHTLPLCVADDAGLHYRDMLPADLSAHLGAAISQIADAGMLSSSFDYRFDDHVHQPQTFEARLSLLQDGEYLLVLRDMTTQRQVQAAIERARDAAEEAARAKSEFLAHMSHEIRTPLNAVIGMAALLLDTDLDVEQRTFTDTIRTGGETLLGIVNNILDLAKIEAGRLDLEAQPFDLHACLEDTIDLVAYSAMIKGLEIEAIIEPMVPTMVMGDQTRLRQILVNMLSNGVKFTEQGSVLLLVSAKMLQPTPEGMPLADLTLSVKDTGIGISAGQLDTLFSPFTQADSSTTRRYGGTGLGLAISRQLSEMMGGSLRAHSVRGAGSTFTLRLTLPVASGKPTQDHMFDLHGYHALVVDDSSANRRLMRSLLERWGMSAHMAESGAIALGLAAIHHYDLALIDMQMPEMNGLALVQAMHQRHILEGVPLVLLSSSEQQLGADERALFAAVMERPVRRTRLSAVLAAVLGIAPKGGHLGELDHQPVTQRILLAEDNPINQQVTLQLLKRLGYQADVVETGVAALEAIQRYPYDLVLMDIQMPEMDGEQATRRIRALSERIRQPRIVALTAYALAGDRERYLAAGMDDYLTKPVQINALRAALMNLPVVVPAPSAKPASSALDWSILEGVREALGSQGTETLKVILRIFYETTPVQLAAIGTAISAGEREQLRALAHRLRGTSRQVGATHMAELCTALEEQARDAPVHRLAATSAELSAEYAAVCASLDERYPQA